MPPVLLDGGRAAVASLHDASERLDDLDAARVAAELVGAAADARTPRRSGTLVRSRRVTAGADGATLSWAAAYAGVINFGWPARSIHAQPFATDAVDAAAADIDRVYTAAVTDALTP